jgi:hypothetical protein
MWSVVHFYFVALPRGQLYNERPRLCIVCGRFGLHSTEKSGMPPGNDFVITMNLELINIIVKYINRSNLYLYLYNSRNIGIYNIIGNI